ncbi:MAG TPA: hypothetical protein VGL09_04890 [Methylomirabilota bacterium]
MDPPVVVHTPDQLLREPPSQRLRANASASREEASSIGRLPGATAVSAAVIAYSPRELVFDVDAGEDGWLLVTERWGRSWRLTVNGAAQANYGANFIFRAAPVTAGHNHVSFVYVPLAFPWLPLMSWGSLALVAGLRTAVMARSRT